MGYGPIRISQPRSRIVLLRKHDVCRRFVSVPLGEDIPPTAASVLAEDRRHEPAHLSR